MSFETFVQAQHTARLVAVADSLRAFLGQCVEDEPAVVSLRVCCTHQASGLSVIEWELVEANGIAIGGGSL